MALELKGGSGDWARLIFFTTEYTETRFAGHGRQFEKIPFGLGTVNPPTLYWGEGAMNVRSVFFPIAFRVRRSRLPSFPWFDFPRPAAMLAVCPRCRGLLTGGREEIGGGEEVLRGLYRKL